MYNDAFALASSSVDASVNAALKKQRRQLNAKAKEQQAAQSKRGGTAIKQYARKARAAAGRLRRSSTT